MKYEFTAEELRDIIFGRTVFRKCPSCDNDGLEYWDEQGISVRPSPLPEWGEDYVSGDCENCGGLGYNKFEN